LEICSDEVYERIKLIEATLPVFEDTLALIFLFPSAATTRQTSFWGNFLAFSSVEYLLLYPVVWLSSSDSQIQAF